MPVGGEEAVEGAGSSASGLDDDNLLLVVGVSLL
jgi:hypothetical protein